LPGQQAIADSDTFTFDDASRLLAAVSGRYNNTVAFQYGDGAGRRTSEALTVNLGQARTYTVGSGYDVVGRLARITYPDGGLVDRTWQRH